ncbi:MAG TPA: type II/IV secretion system protein [Dehalococcoidia bacterium]|nr:type II/IV secretion system protein [Dehalococcoidia bacterium]
MSSKIMSKQVEDVEVAATLTDKPHVTLLQKQFPTPEAIRLIPEALARKYNAIPVEVRGGTLLIAIANPADIFALEALAAKSRMRIEPHRASRDEIREAIDRNYQAYDEIEKQVSSITLPKDAAEELARQDAAQDAPVAQAFSLIIEEAVKARASDVHFQPQEDKLQIRFRIDGTLQNTMSLPAAMSIPLVSRMKILANMNIADHHHTQDGQFSFKMKGRKVDVRVGTIPTVCGEMAVLRLLDKSRSNLQLAELGFLPDMLKKYQKMLEIPYGMILVSGPTGAGKTTTLYASVNCINHLERNVITIEDPVEYRFRNINQIQVNTRAGLDFSTGLRAILRLDPDVILVGEIRDAETAKIAIQGALTGHLVLSSIHANDAFTVVSRLLDLGIEPFLVSSALIGVVAQRMVRRVCPYCTHREDIPLIERLAYTKETGEEETEFSVGKGCQACADTGYQGRTGIFELLQVNDEIRALLINGADIADVRAKSIERGMVPLIKDGMLKVKAGITTPAEVLRNTNLGD